MVLADVSSGDTILAAHINNIHDAEHILNEIMFFNDTGLVVSAPGVAYVEATNKARTLLDFSRVEAVYMRIITIAQGDEAGADKGMEIYDLAHTQQLCEVEWTGNALSYAAGLWIDVTALALADDTIISLRVKGSSATEDITIYKAAMQLRYRFDH
jgi:hypothetical protein